MKLVVVSDNHGKQRPIEEIRQQHRNADAFFHCGDSELPASFLDGFVSVCGNNDYTMELPESRIVEIDGLRIFITHGHRYLYFGRLDMLISKARQENCQLVLYGHTHVFHAEMIDGIQLVNPGSVSHNRDGTRTSYAIVEYKEGKFNVIRMDY